MVSLLELRRLCVDYYAGGRRLPVLTDVSFEITEGEVIGLLGESGCGKTTTGLAILGLVPASAELGGSIRFRGRELLGLRERELEKLRGRGISMVFQEPRGALNPVLRVGDQVAEVIRAHAGGNSRRRRAEAGGLLELVGFEEPDRIFAAYPHELSGGQLQRISIAQALASKPGLIIADEPTASLDAIAQAEILRVLQALQCRLRFAVLLISHNLAVATTMAHRLLIMYAGRIVETGSTADVCSNPLHPYTRALLACVRPAPDRAEPGKHIVAISGVPADLMHPEPGCQFEPRCGDRIGACRTCEPSEKSIAGSRSVRCLLYDE